MKKLSLYVFLVLMCCNVGFAECIKGDCNNGYGTFIFEDGVNTYVGKFKNGVPNGQGTFTFVNGNKYVGEFKNAKRNGLGTYTFANGTVDKGIWKNNQLIDSN